MSVCLYVCQAEAARKKKEAEWEKKELARLKREKKKEKREKEKREAKERAHLKEQEEYRAEYYRYGNRSVFGGEHRGSGGGGYSCFSCLSGSTIDHASSRGRRGYVESSLKEQEYRAEC